MSFDFSVKDELDDSPEPFPGTSASANVDPVQLQDTAAAAEETARAGRLRNRTVMSAIRANYIDGTPFPEELVN